MNAAIESAFAAWLAEAQIDAPVHTGVSAEDFDPERLALIVSVPEVEHSAGPLHRAKVSLVVSGPAYHATVATYREAAAALRSLVDRHADNGLAAAFDEEGGLVFGGLWLEESVERVEEDRWIHSLALSVGLVAAP